MNNYKFNANEATRACIDWIKTYFVENGDENTKAIIGISGGKDSSVAAALCVEALGKDRVIGVKMPQGIQHDIEYADKLIDFLKIKSITVNIKDACDALYAELDSADMTINPYTNKQIYSNLPARIRMTTLYAIAAAYHGRVANTCNYSEDYVGYATKFGDNAGDFSPLGNLTTDEVIAIGQQLNVPQSLLEKVPEDGLSGLTDEENLGFTYETLNAYLRKNIIPDVNTYLNIQRRFKLNAHKRGVMPHFVLSTRYFE